MTKRETEALEAVKRVLAGLPAGHGLEARYVADSDATMDPGIEILSTETGLRSVVHVQVGDADMSVNRSSYETVDLGDGLSTRMFDGVAFGTIHERATPAFEAELGRTLRANLDAFEAVAGIGVGTHPLTREMVEAVRPVVMAYNAARPADEALKIDLNVLGQAADQNDVLNLMRPDGTAIPIAMHTGYGEVVVCNIDDNELIERVRVDRKERLAALPAALQAALDGLDASYALAP